MRPEWLGFKSCGKLSFGPFWEGHDFSRADKHLSVVIPSGLEAREESPFPTFSARQLSCQSVPPNWCSRNCALPDSHRTESFLLSLLLARVRPRRRFLRYIHRRRWHGPCLRPCRQSSLRDQLHRPVNRDAHRSVLLIHPAVTVQSLFFLHAEIFDLEPLVLLQPRQGEFVWDIFSGRPRSFRCRCQRVRRRLMRLLVRSEEHTSELQSH